MDECASVLLGFPPDKELADDEQYDKAVKAHVQRVSRLMKDQAVLVSANAGELLEHMDPNLNSISYLVLLHSLFDATSKSSAVSETVLDRAATFLLTFDPRQIRYAGTPFSNLLSLVESGDVFPAQVAVELLTQALLRLDPTGSMFTSHHLPLVKLAYDINHVEPVLKLINKNIVFYPAGKNYDDSRRICDLSLPPVAFIHLESGLTEKLTPSAVLEYDILCGQCHLSRCDWQAAFDAFERVLTFPTRDHGCSKIMVDAYNKWILVGLLLKGKSQQVPPLSGQGAQRAYSTTGKPYLAIAKAFEENEGGATALKAEIEGPATKFWTEDGNVGLIGEVVKHYQRWQIVNLRDVYSKISIEEIRRCTQSAYTGEELAKASEVEELIQSMISSGMLSGVIEKPDGAVNGDGQGYLTFLPPGEELTETQFAAELLDCANRIKQLEPLVTAANERLGTSRDFIKHLVKQERVGMDSHRGDPGVEFDSQIEDEDLMSGILTSHPAGI